MQIILEFIGQCHVRNIIEISSEIVFSRSRLPPARHHLGLDEEADPADDDEHEARQVDLHHELHLLPLHADLETTGSIGT